MHLSLARLVSMPVTFFLLPSSSIVILVFYLFSTDQWTACVRTVSVIQFTGLTLPLRITPMNNPITLYITSTVAGLHFLLLRRTANFRKVFSESQNANPLDAESEPDVNAKWPFKVIQGHRFRCQPLRGYIVQYNNCGLECEGSEDIAGERSENRHLRQTHPHWRPLSSKPPRIST